MKKVFMAAASGLMALTLGGCGVKYAYELTSPDETTATEEETEAAISLNIRYCDDRYTDYLNDCIKRYTKSYDNVDVSIELVSSENYIKEINSDAVQKGRNIDLYIASNSDLGTAYLAGLAAKNTSDGYTDEAYSQAALNACSYKDYLVGYPLAYETSFLVYNADFMAEKDVETFAKIETFATSIDFSSDEVKGIQSIFRCDLGQSFGNYGFVGYGMDIGGGCGDDAGVFNVNNEKTVKLAQQYLSLIQYFNLESDMTYDKCVKQFTSGKILATIVGLDAIGEIEESEINYKIAAFPDYNAKDKAAPLSITSVLVVNPYSPNQAAAAQLAEFISFDCADSLYGYAGMLSAKKGVKYDNSKLESIYDSYDKSVPKNKLLYGEQVYPLIEIALHNIVAGADIGEELQKIDDYMKTQLQ